MTVNGIPIAHGRGAKKPMHTKKQLRAQRVKELAVLRERGLAPRPAKREVER